MTSPRSVRQDPHNTFIGILCYHSAVFHAELISISGSVDNRNIQDYVFEGKENFGPFAGVKDFPDWLSWVPNRLVPGCPSYEDLCRLFLPEDVPITLTHGDLHRGNIVVSAISPPEVLAVVDWAHMGWYPDYWGHFKACYTAQYGEEWRD